MAGTGVRGDARHHPRTDGLRRSGAAQPGRVSLSGVAQAPRAGAVGDRAAGAVTGAGHDPALAMQLDGLRPAGVPAVRNRRDIPRQPTAMPDVGSAHLAHPPPTSSPPVQHQNSASPNGSEAEDTGGVNTVNTGKWFGCFALYW